MMMKHFPIYHSGICLGVAVVFQENGVWKLRFMRDDRKGSVFTFAEIASMINARENAHPMLLAKLGFVIEEIEEYTNVPLIRLPKQAHPKPKASCEIKHVNKLLSLVRFKDSPWLGMFMADWYLNGRIQFERVPDTTTMLFELQDNASVSIVGNSSVSFCSFSGNSQLQAVQAVFSHFHDTTLMNHTLRSGYVYGRGEDVRVCL